MEANTKQLLIPKEFVQGFITPTDDVEVQYKVEEYYSPEDDRSIRFDDPEIGVDWGIVDPVLSDKDLKVSTDRDTLDITNEEQAKRIIKNYNPNVVIHRTAYTAVDKAEDEK